MQFQIAFLPAADRGLDWQEVTFGEEQSSRTSRRFQRIDQRLVDICTLRAQNSFLFFGAAKFTIAIA
jgi:hypothetical protein